MVSYRPPPRISPVEITRVGLARFEQLSPLEKLGFFIVLFDIFFTFSRALEFSDGIIGTHLPIGSAIRIIALIIAILAGRAASVLQIKSGVCMSVLSVWLLLTIPFSTWKGNSVTMFLMNWMPAFLAIVVVAALVRNMQQIVRAVYAIGFGSLTIVALNSVFGHSDMQRADFAFGTLSNSNDLAAFLLAGVPGLLMFLKFQKGKHTFIKIIIGFGLLGIIKLVSDTGSRGGMLNMILLVVLLFFWASAFDRMKIAIVAAVVGIAILSFTPKVVLARYATILPFIHTSEEEAWMQDSAEGSTDARKELLRESIALTVRHPLFGVGIGAFEAAAATMAEEEGRRPLWQVAHNTYTQWSAEAGLPAALLYIGALLFCFADLFGVRRLSRGIPQLQLHHEIAKYLLVVMFGYALQCFFGSIGFLPLFSILAALSGSLRHATMTDHAALRHSIQSQAQEPAPHRVPSRVASQIPARA